VRLAGAAKKRDVFSQMGEAAGETVAVIVKADVQGSSEALRTHFRSFHDEVASGDRDAWLITESE